MSGSATALVRGVTFPPIEDLGGGFYRMTTENDYNAEIDRLIGLSSPTRQITIILSPGSYSRSNAIALVNPANISFYGEGPRGSVNFTLTYIFVNSQRAIARFDRINLSLTAASSYMSGVHHLRGTATFVDCQVTADRDNAFFVNESSGDAILEFKGVNTITPKSDSDAHAILVTKGTVRVEGLLKINDATDARDLVLLGGVDDPSAVTFSAPTGVVSVPKRFVVQGGTSTTISVEVFKLIIVAVDGVDMSGVAGAPVTLVNDPNLSGYVGNLVVKADTAGTTTNLPIILSTNADRDAEATTTSNSNMAFRLCNVTVGKREFTATGTAGDIISNRINGERVIRMVAARA